MNTVSTALLAAGLVLLMAGPAGERPAETGKTVRSGSAWPSATWTVGALAGATDPTSAADAALTEVVRTYCVRCHNDRSLRGNLSLEDFDVSAAASAAPVAEKMIRKLRAGMMPPPRMRRPAADSLTLLAETLERRIDEEAATNPDPGSRPFQRLNRAEYEASVADLLGLEVDAGAWLPLDTKSANFDNIADVQMVSPTLLEAYLSAAAEISRLAVGNHGAAPSETQYRVPRWVSQVDRVQGAPYGTRGGTSVVHVFPADAEYVFRISFHHETTGTIVGNGRSALNTPDTPEQVEISIDGEPVALLEVDRWMHVSDPGGVELRTEPVAVRAGPRRMTAAFLSRAEGPVLDLVSPHEWSLASTAIAGTYGVLSLPHLRDLVVAGPYRPTGVSDTPVRERIFTCRPSGGSDSRPCAARIIDDLATRAFRRPLTDGDRSALLSFYDEAAAEGGFELGVRNALEAILASPHFVFRFEEPARAVGPGEPYPISDHALASRLSYFLWGAPPDAELRALADRGALHDVETLAAEARRMLTDPRAEALGTRFAAQWLRLQDLDKVHPDVRLQPDFHAQLADAMRRETELFFWGLVRADKSLLELYSADYSYLNERLARHYGIEGVTGEHFRRVEYPDDRRSGVFGHGSVLTLTSHPGRTSPVLRGKWVMEVLLGTPPPPPPPGVPDLDETGEADAGRLLTTRERMAVHSENPTCNSCHRFMDPIGLALDNYDVTGQWRIRENGAPLDTRGELYDGTPVESPADLQRALLARPIPLVRTFTENLMAYALGRRVEHFDQPTVRRIAAEAERRGYRMSSFVDGIVRSDAFRMQRATPTAPDAAGRSPD